jgi:hypothetical protein
MEAIGQHKRLAMGLPLEETISGASGPAKGLEHAGATPRPGTKAVPEKGVVGRHSQGFKQYKKGADTSA